MERTFFQIFEEDILPPFLRRKKDRRPD